jgi:hypothetical protein
MSGFDNKGYDTGPGLDDPSNNNSKGDDDATVVRKEAVSVGTENILRCGKVYL